ncbi:MAG: SPOR domain-containing protein [Methylophilaceae bacterium]
MQKDQSDQELVFKKRARRRLVGAIALVLLMIILLPMILKDRAGSEPQEKITISLPNELSTTVTPNPAPSPAEFDSNIVPSEPEKLPEASPPEAAPEDIAEEPATANNEVKEPAKPEHDKAEASKKFYVQIGVFTDANNVKQLQAKLNDLGYKSLTEKIQTDKGEKIRLKTQVFAERNEAAKALTNIKDAGLTGMVVSQ